MEAYNRWVALPHACCGAGVSWDSLRVSSRSPGRRVVSRHLLNHSGEWPVNHEVDTLNFRNSFAAKSVMGLASLALVVTLGSCAQSQRDPEGTSSEGGAETTFVFAASSDPVMLDPALASDGETFRVSRQMFEGLVGAAPGTTDVEPLLATKWESAPDGKSPHLHAARGSQVPRRHRLQRRGGLRQLRPLVQLDRPEPEREHQLLLRKLFRGFKTGKTGGIYAGCDAASPTEATIRLNSPFAAFVQAMTLPAFSMQSPAAMEQYDADNTTGTVDDTRFSTYATEHPTGTGPFKFDKWERDQAVTLKANPDYWGDKAKVETVIIRTISDPRARVQELEAGSIDGFDLVGPGDVQALKDKGFQIQNRPGVQHLVPGLQPGQQGAAGRQGAAGDQPRDRQGGPAQVLAAARVEGRDRVHARPGQRLQPERDDVRLRRGEGQVAAQGGRPGEPDAEVRLPDRRLPAVHADPGGHVPGAEEPARGGGHQDHPGERQVEPGLPGHGPDRGRRPRSGTSTCSAGPATTTTRTTSWACSSAPRPSSGASTTRSCSPISRRPGSCPASRTRSRPTRRSARRSPSSPPGVPLAHPAPSLAFAKGVEGYVASPVQDEVWNNVTVKQVTVALRQAQHVIRVLSLSKGRQAGG